VSNVQDLVSVKL